MGSITMCDLLRSDRTLRLADLMKPSPPSVRPETDQEHVASWALKHNVASAPVVSASGQLLGAVPPLALLHVLRHEHIEDLHRLAGILHENRSAIAAIEGPSFSRARHRLPWLLVGLVGSALATLIMSSFETMLQARVAIAFFLPGIVYIADAMGTQTEAIAVRGLSLSHASIRDLLARELWTGVLIGAVLGTVAAAAVWSILGDRSLALAIGVAICPAGAIATAIGLLLPWTFQRLGFDPAYGSGPLATVIQDLLSLLVYFGCLAAFTPTVS